MSNSTKEPPSSFSDRQLDAEIKYYEWMSDEEIDAELHRLGIDPEPTIKAVAKLVQAKLNEWQRRGLLHAEALIAVLLVRAIGRMKRARRAA